MNIDFWPRSDAGKSFSGVCSESCGHIGSSERKKEKEFTSKQLFWLKTAAFPCRWLIQVQWGGRGGIRLWALSVNHTALLRRRHLSPNTKGSAPQGTLKPISSLTCNPSRSRKNRIVESYHIHFFLREGMFRGERTAGTKVVWRDFGICPWKAIPPLTPPFLFFKMTDDALHWESFTFLYLLNFLLCCMLYSCLDGWKLCKSDHQPRINSKLWSDGVKYCAAPAFIE